MTTTASSAAIVTLSRFLMLLVRAQNMRKTGVDADGLTRFTVTPQRGAPYDIKMWLPEECDLAEWNAEMERKLEIAAADLERLNGAHLNS
ncbi:hypothetical protein [Chenggangzhangella methanolivorans]|uniref:Uncharacterized protein n=1 Tax=Chenggangzhangella methanolivorans TaxID=1437009 RepID=A0A9E6UM42_9HYPH|nr:hypothetical protein [Chenggangzhangella methanolivorans]QZO01262.1 hypothetical protein K6K41_07000 [Chenggangzhangella methanolivorans]